MGTERNGDLRVVGGHLALDLVNTVTPRRPEGGEHVEFLPGPEELLAWGRRVGLLDDREAAAVEAAWAGSPGAAGQALAATVEIREAAYRVLARRMGLSDGDVAADLERLWLRWTAATGRGELVPESRGPAAARLVLGAVPALLIPDRLAHACVEFLREGDAGRLRACPIEEGGCGWLFLDLSRNRSRRWCAMEDCGAQAKARRLTEPRRTSRDTGKTRNTGS